MESVDNIQILNDIKKIKDTFSENIDKIGLFGSSLKDLKNANDIDIAIFADNLSVETLKIRLLTLELNYPVNATYINGSYSSIIKMDNYGKQYYHIIVLSDQEAKDRFLQINQDKIEFPLI